MPELFLLSVIMKTQEKCGRTTGLSDLILKAEDLKIIVASIRSQEYSYCMPAFWYYFFIFSASSKFRFQVDYVVTVKADCLVTEFVVKNLNGKFCNKMS